SAEDSLYDGGRPPAIPADRILGRRQDLVAWPEIRRRRPGKILSKDGGGGGDGVITRAGGVRAAARGDHRDGVLARRHRSAVDPLRLPVEAADGERLVHLVLGPPRAGGRRRGG